MRMLFNRAWGRILTDHFSEFTSGLVLEGELQDQQVIDIDPSASIGPAVQDDGDPLAALVAEAPEGSTGNDPTEESLVGRMWRAYGRQDPAETPQDAPEEPISDPAPSDAVPPPAQEEPESEEDEPSIGEDCLSCPSQP